MYQQDMKSYSSNEPQGLGVKEDSVLQNLISQFEKANSEQSHNLDRLFNIQSKLNVEPPSSEIPQERINKMSRLTSGEGMLSQIESMLSKYQELVNSQYSILLRLEKLI